MFLSVIDQKSSGNATADAIAEVEVPIAVEHTPAKLENFSS